VHYECLNDITLQEMEEFNETLDDIFTEN